MPAPLNQSGLDQSACYIMLSISTDALPTLPYNPHWTDKEEQPGGGYWTDETVVLSSCDDNDMDISSDDDGDGNWPELDHLVAAIDKVEEEETLAPTAIVDDGLYHRRPSHHCPGTGFCQATVDCNHPDSLLMLDTSIEEMQNIQDLIRQHERLLLACHQDEINVALSVTNANLCQEIEQALYQQHHILCLPPPECESVCGWIAFCGKPCAVAFAMETFLVKHHVH